MYRFGYAYIKKIIENHLVDFKEFIGKKVVDGPPNLSYTCI